MKDRANGQEATAGKTTVLLISVMASFLNPLAFSAISVALPSIGHELSLDAISLNWVVTAYILATAAFLVPLGRLADIYGRKRVFQIGVVLGIAATVLCAISPSGGWLIVFRAIQGLGAAMTLGTAVAILTSVYPPQERGRAIGYTAAAVYSGLAVGPWIGGFITEHLGWQYVFILNALMGVIIAVGVFAWLKGEWVGARGEKFDYQGSIIYCLAMVLLVYAFSVLPALWGLALVITALAGFFIFVRWETRQEFPVLKIELFRKNTLFALSNLAAFISYSATTAVSFLLSLYLQYIKGFTPGHAGLILVAQPVVMAVFSPIAGNLSDRVEPRFIVSLGMVFTTAGLVMLVFLNNDTSLVYILASLFVLGVGFGLFSSPNTNAIMSSVDRRFYGIAASMVGTMRVTGQVFSLGLVLLLFSLYIGRVEITPCYHPLFLKASKIAFIISAILCFAGIFASISRGKAHGDGIGIYRD